MRVPTKPFDGSVGGVACSAGSAGNSVLALLPAEVPPAGRKGVGAILCAGLKLLTFMIGLAFNWDEGIKAASLKVDCMPGR